MTPTSVIALPPVIPALPPSLQRVPSWLDHPETPMADDWRKEWPRWIENLKDFRVYKAKQTALNPSLRAAEMAECANDTAYFLAVYGWFFEPRETPLGPPNWYPWALMPHQVIALRQLRQAMHSPKPRSDIVWEKSRDMAATWTAMGEVAARWLFDDAFTAGLASYKEDAVDDGTPDSMFFKIRGLLGFLEYGESPGIPFWMKPEGFIPMVHGRRLKLNHPSKMCVIKGEATTMRTGTGFRNTLRVNDEGAKHEMLNETMGSIRATTNHILTLSSAYTKYGRDFQNLAEKARLAENALDAGTPDAVRGPRYFRMEWWMHPFHTQEWFDNEADAYISREDFAREVMIDYKAGDSTLIYFDEAEKIATHRLTDEGDNPEHDLLIGIDPGKRDRTGIVFTNLSGNPFRPTVRWFDSYEAANKPPIFYAWLLSGIPPEPGEEGYDLYAPFLGENERRIMAFMLQNWLSGREFTIVMDPAGAQVTLASMTGNIKPEDNNFPRILDQAVYDLRERYHIQHSDAPMPQGLDIRWKHLYRTNTFEPRRDNLRSVMGDSEVSKTPGGYRLLACWKDTRFQDRTRETTSEPGVIKDENYHLVAASEYTACHVKEYGRPDAVTTTGRRAQRDRAKQRERKKVAA